MTAQANKKWLASGFYSSKPTGKIDRENGIIEGVSVCTEGEAKGHGVNLDSAFIETVTRFGNKSKSGLKARFGHPNMCSTALGTFIGRFKNFRDETVTRNDGSKARRSVADLFVSNEAKETPNGDLYSYIFNMAQNEPDMFGTSIVFSPGREYVKTTKGKNAYIVYETTEDGKQKFSEDGCACFAYVDEDGKVIDTKEDPVKDETIYVECAQLHACDMVDEPAANDGLFSRFSQETIAGQLTEFLDLHPQVWGALSANPQIIEALAKYGKKADEFFAAYQLYKAKEAQMSVQDNGTEAEPIVPTKPEPETIEPVKPEGEPENTTGEQTTPPALEVDPREEFKKMRADFGNEIAATVFANGGTYDDAKTECIKQLKAENADLREKYLSVAAGGKPSSVASPASNDNKKLSLAEICEKGTKKV